MKSILEVEKALEPLRHRASDSLKGGLTTETSMCLAESVGNPQEKLRIVHVAGTSGKTSTCYGIRDLLEQSGCKTGLTMSPHMVSIADRVQVGGSNLSEEDFCNYFTVFYEKVQKIKIQPSYFEFMMVFALWVFDKEKVDYAIVETGLGGLHDSSNICKREDKLCVITDIGLDHTKILGTTIEKIAEQKAGIIWPGNTAVMYEQSSVVNETVGSRAKHMNAKLQLVEPPVTNDYRERNHSLAEAVYDLLQKRDGLPIRQQTLWSVVPGRLEQLTYGDAHILLDGAHNEQKMSSLVSTLDSANSNQKYTVVFAMKPSKDFKAVLAEIKPITARIIITVLRSDQDFANDSVEPAVLHAECVKLGIDEAEVEPDIKQALGIAASYGLPVLVTGSLFVVSDARKLLTSD